MDRVIRKIALLICCFIVVSTTLYADTDADLKGELINRLETSEHDSVRLNTLNKLMEVSKSDPKAREYYALELLKEGEYQKSSLHICRAYVCLIYISYNENNTEKLRKWLDLLIPVARNAKLYDLMFQGIQCDIDLLVLNEAYEELENKAQKMLREAQSLGSKRGIVLAYQSIARAYRVTSRIPSQSTTLSSHHTPPRLSQAASMLDQAYMLSLEIDDFDLLSEISNSQIATYKELKNYPRLLECVQERERVILKELRKNPSMKEQFMMDFFYLYISYAEYYLLVGDLQNVKRYMLLTDKYYSDKYFINKLRYHEMRKNYFVDKQEWNKALVDIDSLIVGYQLVEYTFYNRMLLTKADVLSNMGDYSQALPLYERALWDNDSILVSVYNKQVDFLKNVHTLEKMQIQTLNFRYYISISILVLVVVISAVLLVFFFFSYRINRALNKSDKEMRLIAAEVFKVNKVKEAFISNMNTAISNPLTLVVDCSLALASDQKYNAEEKEHASEVISKTAVDLSLLINDILDLSRLEAGMMKFQLSDLALNSYLDEAITIARINGELQADNKLNPKEIYTIHYDGNWLYRLMRTVFVSVPNSGRMLRILIEKGTDEIIITVRNSALSVPNPSQGVMIQNEMNRMLVEHFGGKWTVTPQYVQFTIPIKSETTIA